MVPGPWEDHLGRGAGGRGFHQRTGHWVLGTEIGLMNPGPQVRTLSAALGLSISNRPHGAPTVWGRWTRKTKEGHTFVWETPAPLPSRTHPRDPWGQLLKSVSASLACSNKNVADEGRGGSPRSGGLEVRGQDASMADFRLMMTDLSGPSPGRERLGP